MDYDVGRVVDVVPGLVWSALADGRVQFVNRRWREYTGLDLGQSADAEWRSVIHPEDLPRWLERWPCSDTSLEPWELELRLRRFDGTYRWFLCRACAETGAFDHVERWWGVNTDIEEALKRARSELAHVARLTTVSALIASIAHEVNQPLSGIITNANTCLRMLAREPPNVDAARETARRTIRDGNRASEVIGRLRALFARKTPTLERLDLNEATREVIALLRSELRGRRAVMRVELAENLPIIMGDRIQLQQVIMNLLRNAAEAMHGVDDRPREIAVTTSYDDEGDRVCLSVQDSGVGFGPQGLEEVFDAFYTTKQDGMGIGLSISRSIIVSHRGRLWAAPNDGPGVTFSFAIPRGLDFGASRAGDGAPNERAATS